MRINAFETESYEGKAVILEGEVKAILKVLGRNKSPEVSREGTGRIISNHRD